MKGLHFWYLIMRGGVTIYLGGEMELMHDMLLLIYLQNFLVDSLLNSIC